MSAPDRKRRRRAEALFQRREARVIFAETGPEIALDELHELAALTRGDTELEARLNALDNVGSGRGIQEAYVARYGVVGVRSFRTSLGATVFLMPVETFTGHINNVYLVVDGSLRILIDAGSGTSTSRRELARALAVVRDVFGVAVSFETLDLVVITHAHMDHYGGVMDLRARSTARIAVHELDARVLSNFEERLVVAAKDIDVFMRRAGVEADRRARFSEMYTAEKRFFRSIEPDRVLHDGDVIGNGMRVHHVPGHCPGLICIQIGDVLLTSDHVLSRITPHQFPQAITPFAGLEHYFRSLARIRKLEGIDIALGGHEAPMYDLRSRIDEISTFHRVRLSRVLEICAEPRSTVEVSAALFGPQEGYGTLLALFEAGAHVEYLSQVGQLRIHNLAEVAAKDDPVIRYEARN